MEAYLHPDHYQPASPYELPGMQAAVEILQEAIKDRKRICVWGDFDVDGQTATAVLVSALRQLGAQVRFHIPVRAIESHGISLPILQTELAAGLDLLLTCDTGIAAHEAIQAAAAQGIQTVITDHHTLPPELPPAQAIVNPRLLQDQAHPLASLPVVGVAYKLAEALFDRFSVPQAAQDYLDLVALGIVADVASLVKDGRYLLQLGLRKLQDPTRPGLKALYEIAGIKPGSVNEETIAFVLAPRLNAVGRLSDANPIVDFFTTSDQAEVQIQAQVIESFNAQRKLLTDQVFKAALSQVERDPALLETSVIVLSYPTWPAGVIGIIASRLVEYFHKPVILLSTPPGELARGSARSIPGIDITQAIASQAALLTGYGGHPMAAGLSIQPERIPDFRKGLSQAVHYQVSQKKAGAEFENALFFDAHLPFSSLSLGFVQQLEGLAPFGPGNPSPILVAQNVRIASQQAIGLHDEHLLLRVLDTNDYMQEVIWWQAGSLASVPGFTLPEGSFDLAYSVHSHDFNGQQSIQVEWLDYQPLPQPEVELPSRKVHRSLVDHRLAPSPLLILEQLRKNASPQVWCEGPSTESIAGSDRFHLAVSDTLVIWTIPAGRPELLAAIDKVTPQTIVFFGLDPGLDQPAPFIRHLVEQIKPAVQQPGQPVDLPSLAAALAHQPATIRLGLTWLQAKGKLKLDHLDDQVAVFKPGQAQSTPDLASIEASLRAALAETKAFRAYYLRASLESLL
jgi:single-stranded-DNA-specific exonuclease